MVSAWLMWGCSHCTQKNSVAKRKLAYGAPTMWAVLWETHFLSLVSSENFWTVKQWNSFVRVERAPGFLGHLPELQVYMETVIFCLLGVTEPAGNHPLCAIWGQSQAESSALVPISPLIKPLTSWHGWVRGGRQLQWNWLHFSVHVHSVNGLASTVCSSSAYLGVHSSA